MKPSKGRVGEMLQGYRLTPTRMTWPAIAIPWWAGSERLEVRNVVAGEVIEAWVVADDRLIATDMLMDEDLERGFSVDNYAIRLSRLREELLGNDKILVPEMRMLVSEQQARKLLEKTSLDGFLFRRISCYHEGSKKDWLATATEVFTARIHKIKGRVMFMEECLSGTVFEAEMFPGATSGALAEYTVTPGGRRVVLGVE